MAGPVLYSPAVLALATGLAGYPFDPDAGLVGEARSPTCGSSIIVSLKQNRTGAVTRTGIRAHACAIGQASAMLFAEGAGGRTQQDLATADREIADWLAGGPLPG
jgi:NifU-like protein involved in Fe-S cluster formation